MKTDDIWKNTIVPVGKRKITREQKSKALYHRYQLGISRMMDLYAKLEQDGKLSHAPLYSGDFESYLVSTPSGVDGIPEEFYVKEGEEGLRIKKHFEQTFEKLRSILTQISKLRRFE